MLANEARKNTSDKHIVTEFGADYEYPDMLTQHTA